MLKEEVLRRQKLLPRYLNNYLELNLSLNISYGYS